MDKIKVAILASGSGSNAENLARYFAGHPRIQISDILSNKAEAYVLTRSKELGIPASVFSKTDLESGDVSKTLRSKNVKFIILAGFLLKIPTQFISDYEGKIINIHPSLLPAYGGKGMYGSRVHEAVISNRESKSGITIHLVTQNYDEGPILAQHECPVIPGDDAESLAAKVHELEYHYFPPTVKDYILKSIRDES